MNDLIHNIHLITQQGLRNKIVPTRRLKRHKLVESLFFLFSQEYDSCDCQSIMELEIPLERVFAYLQAQLSVSYSGNQWIFTQLRNYEEDIGSRLFEKVKKDDGRLFLKLHPQMEAFSQKRHLYVSQKIKTSNGLYDLIVNTLGGYRAGEPVKLLLGAGSTCYHLADILASRSKDDPLHYDIYTHNISIVNRFLETPVNNPNNRVFCPGGAIDPVTNTIMGSYKPMYGQVAFDYIIQGTSFLSGGLLYVEQPGEVDIKREILREMKGHKVLVLTGHEVRPSVPVDTQPFGRLTDYNTLVISNNKERTVKNIDQMLLEQEKILTAEILNWNYRIYRISSC